MARKRRNKGTGPLSHRSNTKLTVAQQEAVVRIYFTNGNVAQTAREVGVSQKAVRNAIKAAQNDPNLMAARGQALDQMAGQVFHITNQVLGSITPEELVTTRHEVRDTNNNLLRIVTEGPSLKDKALAIGILADKQRTLMEARNAAVSISTRDSAHNALMLPEDIQDKRKLIAAKIKRLRVLDVHFREGEGKETLDMVMNKAGLSDADVEDAEFETVVISDGAAPFD